MVPDSDRDGRSNLHDADSDADGLNDKNENQSPEGSDPSLADTDQDGMTDQVEAAGWAICSPWGRWTTSNPRLPDTDLDGLTDAQEKAARLDPRGDTDADGLSDPMEQQGWAVNANGEARLVTSDPCKADQDGDQLLDAGEFSLGTDPRLADTDVDGASDYAEDWDHDAQGEEGETSALDRDSDDDGLTDGEEAQLAGGELDPLAADTDDDDVSDFAEVRTYGTNPVNEDTDGDRLPDGVELGLPEAGGSPDRVTDAKYFDTDHDGFSDGGETYYYGTNPLVADTDCDGQEDSDDPNPYTANVPPGEARPATERACPSAPTGNFNLALADLPLLSDVLQLPVGTASAEAASGDVGLLVFDSDGTITMLARAPESEAAILAVQAVVWLDGQIRISADGALSAGSGRITAELQPIDEPTADEPGSNPWTHAVRMALPEGMVEATSATWGLTFVDANLNSATYTGEASGFQLEEVVYQDELTPADEQDYDDPTNSTPEGSGWDYVHGNLTGTQPEPEPMSASMAGFSVGLGNQTEQGRYWIYRIVQPEEPTLVGAIVDDQLVLQAPGHMQVPIKAVLYTDTGVEVPDDEVNLYTQANWFGSAAKLFKKVVQATTKVFTAVVSSAAVVYNKAAQVVKSTTLAIYDEMRNPRTPVAFAARMAIDIVGIGDVIDIIDGVQKGDWLQVGIGAACLAMTVIPVLKGPVSAMKASLRVAEGAGASMKLLNKVGSTVQAFVKEGAAAAPKIDRLNDVLHKASVGSSAKKPLMKGVEVVLEAEGGNVVGTRRLVDTTLNAGLAGKQAATKGEAAAEAIVRQTKNSPELPYSSLAKTDAKLSVQAPDAATQVVDVMRTRQVTGLPLASRLTCSSHHAR